MSIYGRWRAPSESTGVGKNVMGTMCLIGKALRNPLNDVGIAIIMAIGVSNSQWDFLAAAEIKVRREGIYQIGRLADVSPIRDFR